MIFITEDDVIGKGKPLYRIERKIEEVDEPFDDGEHIIYVNGADKKAEERTTVNHIKDIMESFGVTIEKAMEALKIPVAQWDMYAGLVGKHVQ